VSSDFAPSPAPAAEPGLSRGAGEEKAEAAFPEADSAPLLRLTAWPMSAEAWLAAGRWAGAPAGNFPVAREAEWLRAAAQEGAVRAASFAWRCRPACWALAPASGWDLLRAVVPRAVAAAIGELPGSLAARSFEPESLALARQRLRRKGQRKTKCSREQKKDGDSKRLVAPQLKLQFCPQFRLRQLSSPYGNQPRGSIGGAV
jgi:hypothetical protein